MKWFEYHREVAPREMRLRRELHELDRPVLLPAYDYLPRATFQKLRPRDIQVQDVRICTLTGHLADIGRQPTLTHSGHEAINSFDQLVSAHEKRGRHCDSERLRRLEINHEL